MEAALTIVTELEQYLRKESLTISQFAKHASLHSGTLSNIMHGRRPISMQQLDRIIDAMGYPPGFLYDVYIDNYVIEGSSDWRRIGPLMQRSAELGKLNCIRRVAQHILDNLIYSPLLFDTAEEMYAGGYPEAAAVLFECVAEAERFQHSERLALCQFRLFTISLGDDQDKNLWAANRFEPFVERLDEVDQLDALRELANTYRSLRRWDKVDELAEKMGHKARIQYELMTRLHKKARVPDKKPSKPLFVYIAYSNLLRANACDESGDYEQALNYKYAYGDLGWVREQGSEEEYWKKLFIEWSQANIYITKLLSGDSSVIPSYTEYIRKQSQELVTGLLYIMKAANKYNLNVDETLQLLQGQLKENFIEPGEGRYNRKLALDRQANLMYEISNYYLNKGNYSEGFELLLGSLRNYQQINNEKNSLECVMLFEKFRKFATLELRMQYKCLLLGGKINEENSSPISNSD